MPSLTLFHFLTQSKLSQTHLTMRNCVVVTRLLRISSYLVQMILNAFMIVYISHSLVTADEKDGISCLLFFIQ